MFSRECRLSITKHCCEGVRGLPKTQGVIVFGRFLVTFLVATKKVTDKKNTSFFLSDCPDDHMVFQMLTA